MAKKAATKAPAKNGKPRAKPTRKTLSITQMAKMSPSEIKAAHKTTEKPKGKAKDKILFDVGHWGLGEVMTHVFENNPAATLADMRAEIEAMTETLEQLEDEHGEDCRLATIK